MNKIPVLIAIIILLQGATQCNTQPLPQITGKIVLAEGWKPMLYLVEPRSFTEIAASFSGIVIDSASIASDGSFAFANVPLREDKTLLQICIQKTGARFPNQFQDDYPLLSNYMPVVLQKDTRLEVAASADRFQATFTLQNPRADNLALLQLRDIRHRAYREQQNFLYKAGDHSEEAFLLEQEDALQQFQLPLKTFADSTTHLWPALVAVHWVSPAGDYERVPEFLVGQCQKWQIKVPDNQWVAQLCQAANRERLPIMTGDSIPNYPLPMVSGDTVLLHNLLGSRLTILDIWASWCAPCRRENRTVLLPIWTQYHDNGLQIIGYSIDAGASAWKAAIAKDTAKWPHASHLSGDATPFLETLRITTIPANFILNAEGKVVAKNLHGEALKSFVASFLK